MLGTLLLAALILSAAWALSKPVGYLLAFTLIALVLGDTGSTLFLLAAVGYLGYLAWAWIFSPSARRLDS